MAFDTTPGDLLDVGDPGENGDAGDEPRVRPGRRRLLMGFLLAALLAAGLGTSGAMAVAHQAFVEAFPETCCGCEPC